VNAEHTCAYVAVGLASAYADVDTVTDGNGNPLLHLYVHEEHAPEIWRRLEVGTSAMVPGWWWTPLPGARLFAWTLLPPLGRVSLARLRSEMDRLKRARPGGEDCDLELIFSPVVIAIGRNRRPDDVAELKTILAKPGSPVPEVVKRLERGRESSLGTSPFAEDAEPYNAALVRHLWLHLHRLSASAAIALGEIGDPRADDALLNALYTEDEDRFHPLRDSVRAFSTISLGEIGSERTVGPLVDFIYHQDEDDRLRCFAILARVLYARPRQTPQVLYTSPGARKALAAIDSLLRTEEERDPLAAAAMAAGLSTDSSFIPLLRQHLDPLGAGNTDRPLQGYLMLALGMLQDEKVFDPIVAFLADTRDKNSREAIRGKRLAVLGLASLRTDRAIPELQKVLGSND
jgi:HEAT repeat protein